MCLPHTYAPHLHCNRYLFSSLSTAALQASEPYRSCARTAAARQALERSTFVQRVFGGELVDQLLCPACGACSSTSQPFVDLSLDIAPSSTDTVLHSLEAFTQPEQLGRDNKYTVQSVSVVVCMHAPGSSPAKECASLAPPFVCQCTSCEKPVQAYKRMAIAHPPNVLVLHLKRFRPGFYGKINKPIEFDSSLNLAPFCVGTRCATTHSARQGQGSVTSLTLPPTCLHRCRVPSL